MRLGNKRVEEHGKRYVHLVDPNTSRGILLYCDLEREGLLGWIRKKDIDRKGGQEAMIVLLARNGYIPKEVPDQEFNNLYERLSAQRGPLFRETGDFEPSDTPTIRDIAQQNGKDYSSDFVNYLKQFAKIRS